MNKSDVKVCAYAICKNELQYIDRWLDLMSEADYIVVLDTGSTDGSYEKLKNDKRVTRVEQKVIKPWRFDVARNESLKLVPDEATFMFCMDFDEVVNKGWSDVIRETVANNPGTNKLFYHYAWSHDIHGKPTDVFELDKCHNRDFCWNFPAHEVIWNKDGCTTHSINVKDKILVQHYRNEDKDRTGYLALLELSAKENPTDSHVALLLAREYMLKGDYDKALSMYLAIIDMPDTHTPGKNLILLDSLGRIADFYRVKGEIDKAIEYCNKFLKVDSTYREPYFILATCYNELKLYDIAIEFIKLGLEHGVRKPDWVERADFWTFSADDILSVSYINKHDPTHGIEHIVKALEYKPEDVRMLRNYNLALRMQLDDNKEKLKKLGEKVD